MLVNKLFDPQDYKKLEYQEIRDYFEAWWQILRIERIKFTYSSLNRAWEYGQIINSVDFMGKFVLDLGTSISLFPIYAYRKLHAFMTTFDKEYYNERSILYSHTIPDYFDIDSGSTEIDCDLGDLMQDLKYETGQFDIVTCFSTIEHLPSYDKAVSEMKRVCKKGGYICLTTDFMPNDPHAEKSGSTFNYETLDKFINKFDLPLYGETNYKNVDLAKRENLAVGGKYTFASIVFKND